VLPCLVGSLGIPAAALAAASAVASAVASAAALAAASAGAAFPAALAEVASMTKDFQLILDCHSSGRTDI